MNEEKKVIIQETEAGYAVNGALHKSLKEAIEAADYHYTFVPNYRKSRDYVSYTGAKPMVKE